MQYSEVELLESRHLNFVCHLKIQTKAIVYNFVL